MAISPLIGPADMAAIAGVAFEYPVIGKEVAN
jgi:hypothetical protein